MFKGITKGRVNIIQLKRKGRIQTGEVATPRKEQHCQKTDHSFV